MYLKKKRRERERKRKKLWILRMFSVFIRRGRGQWGFFFGLCVRADRTVSPKRIAGQTNGRSRNFQSPPAARGNPFGGWFPEDGKEFSEEPGKSGKKRKPDYTMCCISRNYELHHCNLHKTWGGFTIGRQSIFRLT